MVKIRNLFGDRYKGRQGDAVYQGRYGKQIRRTWNDRKKNRSPAQEEQKARFRQAHAWIKGLTSEEIEGLKRFTAEHYPGLTWQQYAIKTALDRGKVSVTTHEVSTLKETWRSDWDAPGWPYREDITLTNNMAEDLTGYQKLLELDSTKVGAHFDWSRQGADLRFYDSEGNKLKYWVESWDEQNKQAKVWVRVSQIPAQGSTSIKMYYGNEQAESESNAKEVFDFLDDFEDNDISDWTIDKGSFTVSDGIVETTEKQASLMHKDVTISKGVIFETAVKPGSLGDPGIIFAMQDVNNFYMSRINASADEIQLYKKEAGSFSKVASKSVSISSLWYAIKTIWKSDGTVRIEVYGGTSDRIGFDYESLSLVGTLDYTTATKWLSGYVGLRSYNPSSWDWVRVRKYAEQEPATSVGTEEYGKITTGVVKVRTTVAVSHSGLHAVEVYDDQDNLLVRADGLSDLRSGEVTQVWEWHIDKDQAQPIGRVVYWSISGVRNEWTAGGT